MRSKSNCNLCQEVSGTCSPECGTEYRQLVSSQQNTIFASQNFVVIPSVGPLNNTHVMLVPKTHVNSFGELSKTDIAEGVEILQRLKTHIQEKFGQKLVFFESGAGNLTSHSGGCITHAHIHCVAESLEFERRLTSEVSLKPITPGDYSLTDIQHGYIWFQNGGGSTFICNRPMLPSQFLRYIYAQYGDTSNVWNWRKHINFPLIKDVLEAYRGVSAN